MMFFKNFIKKFASQYSKLQLYEIILKKRISFWRKNDYMMNKCLWRCRKRCRWVIVYSVLLCQMEVTSSLLLSKFRINIHFLMKNSNHFDFIID